MDHYRDDDDAPAVTNDDDLIFQRDYERSSRRYAIQQGIEDYFDRKQMRELDDWYGSLEEPARSRRRRDH